MELRIERVFVVRVQCACILSLLLLFSMRALFLVAYDVFSHWLVYRLLVAGFECHFDCAGISVFTFYDLLMVNVMVDSEICHSVKTIFNHHLNEDGKR